MREREREREKERKRERERRREKERQTSLKIITRKGDITREDNLVYYYTKVSNLYRDTTYLKT